MRKLIQGAIIALMVVGFTGCVDTSDIKVESAKADKVNLDGYKTYQVIEESGVATNSTKDNHDVNAELQRSIATELGKKGKVPVTSNPDFYVAYLAAADVDAIEVKIDKKGQETIKGTPAAAMILLLIDAHTGMVIAISTAEGEVKNLPLKDRKERLNYTVKKMFSQL